MLSYILTSPPQEETGLLLTHRLSVGPEIDLTARLGSGQHVGLRWILRYLD